MLVEKIDFGKVSQISFICVCCVWTLNDQKKTRLKVFCQFWMLCAMRCFPPVCIHECRV